MAIEKIQLIQPRGFCVGVKRAIKIVETALQLNNKPIYVFQQIVHNEHVLNDLEKKGTIFVKKINDIPNDNIVIFSAHGVSPTVRKEAKAKNLKIIDATCPLVDKIHKEAIVHHKKGYKILLIGKKNHEEVDGIIGEAPMILIENINDAKKIKITNSEKIICLSQTTFSINDIKDITNVLQKRFPKIKTLANNNICRATTERQSAVKKIANFVDIILVIGSKKSNNSKQLVNIAKQAWIKSYLILNKTEINKKIFNNVKKIAITAGASTPEKSVQKIVKYLKKTLKC